MFKGATYQSAKLVSEQVETHFREHLKCAEADGETNLAPQPPAAAIEEIIDVAFWASLRKEEGHSPKISLAFLPPDQAAQSLVFKQRFPLNPAMLTKLAPGVERGGIHIGVWLDDENELYVWGTTLTIPNYCFVVDVSEPGLLVVKHRRMFGLGKYTNVVILKGDQVKFVDESYATLADCPPMLLALLDISAQTNASDSANVLIQLAVSMRAHGRGGALLVVPQNSAAWKNSIVHPVNYGVEPPFCGLANLVRKDRTAASEIYWQTALKRETDYLAGLTAVDGATIVTDEFELLAFGAKITRAKTSTQVDKLSLGEPVIGGDAQEVHPGRVGGTRHLSAAQFIFDQRDAFAMVASQDGHFTIYTWSDRLNIIQAHRIDSLLL